MLFQIILIWGNEVTLISHFGLMQCLQNFRSELGGEGICGSLLFYCRIMMKDDDLIIKPSFGIA